MLDYISREAAIEVVERYFTELLELNPDICLDGIKSIPAADVVERPHWIPVTERLPEKRKWVLCRCEANITDVLRFENAEWYHDPTHVYTFDFVTHWMPLPEPPKEEPAPGPYDLLHEEGGWNLQ